MSIRMRCCGVLVAVLGVVALAGCGAPGEGPTTARKAVTRQAGQVHPADANGDGQLSLQEAVAYATAFKRQTDWPVPPTPVPLNFAVNACSLFVRGTTYHYDAAFTPPFQPGAATNQAPTVSAGADAGGMVNVAVALNGSATDDGQPAGSSLTLTWSLVSGPGQVVFANASAAATTATFDAAGTYVVRLTASDGPLSTSDEATITVDARGDVTVIVS